MASLHFTEGGLFFVNKYLTFYSLNDDYLYFYN